MARTQVVIHGIEQAFISGRRALLITFAIALLGCSGPALAPSSGLVITSPANGAQVTGQPITVTGTAPASSAVSRVGGAGEIAAADATGKWSMRVALVPGDNVLTFRLGTDSATAQSIVVTLTSGVVSSPTPSTGAVVTPVATPSPTHAPNPPGHTSAPTPAATAGAHQELELVDSGFSVDKTDVGYAVLVRNPNATEWVATNAQIQVTFSDDSGPIATETSYFDAFTLGQTAATTDTSFDAGHPTKMEVRFGSVDWQSIDFATASFDVAKVKTTSDGYGSTTTKGTLTSHFKDRHENVRLDAVYRDAAGKVIGGDFDYVDFIDPGQTVSFEISGFFGYKGIATTEVYWMLTDAQG